MKINFKKSTLRNLLLIAGVSFALSGCSLENNSKEEELQQSVEYYKNELDRITNDNNYENDDYEQDDDYEQNENNDDSIENIIINDIYDIDQYFKDEISFDLIRQVTNDNPNLLNKDKKRILEVIDKLEEKIPYINLRCLYENVKLLSIERGTNQNSDSTAVANFDPVEHKINLFEDKNHYFYHEVLHMVTLLFLNVDNEKSLYRPFSTENTDFLLDGFTEWFKKYLFDYNEYSYYTQVNDIEIIKYILDLSDEDFIQEVTDKNLSFITESLEKYLTKNEINDWISISEKELYSAKYKSKECITSSEMARKYKILLKACINAKGIIGSSEKYQIMELLFNSCDYYSSIINTYQEEVELLKYDIKNTLDNYLDYNNNDIEIIDSDGLGIDYCDIDHVYLIKVDDGFFIAEEYIDSNGKEKYYPNILYKSADDDIIAPVSSLIEYSEEKCNSYTMDDLIQFYSYYLSDEYNIDTGKGSYQKKYE